jgi:hypothetical protein
VYSPNYPFPYVPKVVCRYCNPRTCVWCKCQIVRNQ